MNKNLLATLAISGAALFATASQAATLSWDEDTTGALNAVFNPAPAIGLASPGATISLGSLLLTTLAGQDAVVTVTYLGQESGYSDGVARASIAGILLTELNAIGSSASFVVAAGTSAPVDIKFFDSVGGFAINGGDWSASNSIGLLGTNVNLGSYGFFEYVLGYNDSGANHDDWDDFIIGVNVKDVPEPASLALLGLGLLGLGMSRRRKA